MQRQRGAAVIVALLIVALATTAAVAALQQQDLALRQLATARDYEQATWVLKGGAHWARSILYEDGRNSAMDHGRELWASGLPPTDIEQGTVSGEIGDQQGLFNVNNLALQGKPNARDIEAFERLLEASGLNPGLAQAIADWIDADEEAQPGTGAEDNYYLRLPARYRAANQPVVELSELLRVRGMDEASLARLRGIATALPRRTPVNVNLASPELLYAMIPGLTLEEARALASTRAQSPFRNLKEFEARLPRRDLKWIEGTLSVESSYFLVRGRSTVGKADVRMEALLQRERGSMPVVLWQRMR
jgi:general secretion pathway protein K